MTLIVSRTTGDAAADRRYAWAAAAAAGKDHAAAADLFAQTLEIAPGFAPAAFALGQSLEALGDGPGAALAFFKSLALDPADQLGATLHLARLRAAPMPASAPPAYVRELFDAYAAKFDAHLVKALGYNAPAVLAQLVEDPEGGVFASVLDLGCGTGLAGEVFRPRSTHLAGVDLSPQMIAAAKAKCVYDRLATGDIGPFLQTEAPASASLIIAADVFVYIGDLAEIFVRSAGVLAPGGLMAFTVQRGEAGISLGDDMRYAHSLAYIFSQAAASGLQVLKSKSISTRRDRGLPVQGFGIVLAKPS